MAADPLSSLVAGPAISEIEQSAVIPIPISPFTSAKAAPSLAFQVRRPVLDRAGAVLLIHPACFVERRR